MGNWNNISDILLVISSKISEEIRVRQTSSYLYFQTSGTECSLKTDDVHLSDLSIRNIMLKVKI